MWEASARRYITLVNEPLQVLVGRMPFCFSANHGTSQTQIHSIQGEKYVLLLKSCCRDTVLLEFTSTPLGRVVQCTALVLERFGALPSASHLVSGGL